MTETPEAPPNPPESAPPPRPPADSEANQWGMFVHLSVLAGLAVPLAGLVVPIVLWQIKKDEFPVVDVHGKIVVNWIISAIIYGLVCFVLTFVVIGIFGFMVLGVLCIVFPIVGGIKANSGEIWEYPLTIRVIQ